MLTKLGYGISLNKASTLPREAITVHDQSLPFRLPSTVTVTPAYEDRGYRYKTDYIATATDTVSAVEVRFILFDVFGERLSTLRQVDVSDLLPGQEVTLKGAWNLWSEAEAERYYGSIAFVSRVRTKSGRVIEADLKPVLAEAQRFSKKFTESDLEPNPERKPD
jgi:hypothetical protein